MKKNLYFALILTLTACTAQTSTIPAPAQQTSEVSETSEVSTSTLPALTVTETLAPTATPEATATPTPEPTVIQKEISFNVTRANGEAITISMPAFIPNIPEGATPEEISEIELETIKEALKFIVNDDVDWGNVKATPLSELSETDLKYLYDLILLPNYADTYAGLAVVTIEPTGDIVPFENNQIGVGVNDVTYDGISGTLLKYITGEGEHTGNTLFVGVHVNNTVPLLKFQTITLDLGK